jgi:hypothetical protein
MTRLVFGLGAAALISIPVLAQTPAARASFEVSGVQVSTRPNPGMRGGVLRGNRYALRVLPRSIRPGRCHCSTP